MNEIKNSIISSITEYLNKLQYLAIDDKKTANDIMLLIISEETYDWAVYNNINSNEIIKLNKFRNTLIQNNPNLIETFNISNLYYKNVNIPESIVTWERLYDNQITKTINTL